MNFSRFQIGDPEQDYHFSEFPGDQRSDGERTSQTVCELPGASTVSCRLNPDAAPSAPAKTAEAQTETGGDRVSTSRSPLFGPLCDGCMTRKTWNWQTQQWRCKCEL